MGEDTQRVARAGGLRGELKHVRRTLVGAGRLSTQSQARLLGLLDRFGLFASRAYSLESLADVQRMHVEAFVRSANAATGALPSVATMRLRRSALRLVFRTARELGLVDGDPTLDLVLPSRTREAARPLTDLEVQQCRRVALEDLTSTRLSVPWALGEATARTAEIPHLRFADLDLSGARVWLHGSSNTEARWGHLTRWGGTQLERHLRMHPPGSDGDLLNHRGSDNPESRRSHSAQALRETMRRADLIRDPYVRPGSLAAWAGRRVLCATGRIDAAALALGVRSLDGAARLIGWDWTSERALPGG